MATRRKIAVTGEMLLEEPSLNKGTAFSQREREDFDLVGRLPYGVNDLDHQCKRAWEQLQLHEDDLRKNSFLQSLKAQNWVLYYALISRHLTDLIPIIYTPTEAEAISNYSRLFRRSEGLFLSFPHANRMEQDYLSATKDRDIDLVVVTDAQQILGIGDQGAGGIGISTAKSVIYTLVGGLHPAKTLPVTLDVGTDNEKLLNDDLYIGWPEKRVTGEKYDEFVDKFVQLVRRHHPHCLLHFEDFGVNNAERFLDKYRDTHSVFNDDVQGTGAVTLAALMAAVGVTKSKVSEQRYIIYGAGSAGLGIAHQIRDAVMMESDGLSAAEASKMFWLIDKEGLITSSLAKSMDSGGHKLRKGLDEFVRDEDEWASLGNNNEGKGISLLDVVKRVHPTVLIGTSTNPGAFNEEVVRAMTEGVGEGKRPIIFPLSNPSRLVEVRPEDANKWSDGKVLMATGSPFPKVKREEGKEYIIAECNNALIYPGIGFGAIMSRSKTVSKSMIVAATRALAELSPALASPGTEPDPNAALLPDFEDARKANLEVAIAVAKQAIEEGVANVDWASPDNLNEDDLRKRVEAAMWEPVYDEYEYDPESGEH
ncbi:hypothetical protein DL93DRAFT_2142422 [Clavulina sp. PMI_390]|nr:hypothetical protein DL93DRAFT_2142422 [Clavulina sp. PMI_390]